MIAAVSVTGGHFGASLGVVELTDDEQDIVHLYDNPATCRFFGIEPGATIGRRASEIGSPPEAIAEWIRHYRRSRDTQTPVRFEYQHTTARGRCWLAATVSCIGPGPAGRMQFSYVTEDISERKRAEEEVRKLNCDLRRRVAEWRTLFDAMPVGIGITLDPKCEHISVNRHLARILGVSTEQNASPTAFPEAQQPYRTYRHGRELRPEELPMQIAAVQGVPTTDDELDIVGADGRVTNLLGYAVPLLNEQGESRGSVGVFVDITERKREQEVLRRTQERLQRIVNSDMIGIVVSSPKGHVVEANDYFLRLIRATREQLQEGKVRWIDITPPEYLAVDFQAVAEARQKGTCKPYEKEYRLRDGQRVPVLIGMTLLPGDEDLVAGFVLDMTERKQAERALRESEERFRGWFDQAAVGAVLMDGEGRYQVLNQRACDILGYSHEEMMQRTFVDVTHPEDRPQDEQQFARLMAGQIRTYSLEKRCIRKDGRIVWVNIARAALRSTSGKLAGSITVIEDITNRKQAEEALRAKEEQLRQAQKMEAIGLLAGGIAHDFRNQLTVIKGYSEMLLRRGLVNQAAREYIEEILKAANRSASLTGELLAFGRKQILQPQVVCLNRVIAEIEKTIRSMLGEDVRLSILPAEDLKPVRIDPAQFQQALVNLAVNARDAMPGGGNLTIETCNLEPEQMPPDEQARLGGRTHVLVTVRDTGMGIDRETLPRIFEPFFTTKPVGRGTGLGLPMVYGFAQQSGGQIDVTSEPGKGTTFRLYFPSESQPAEARMQPAWQDKLDSGSGTILLVEDEEAIRRLAAQTLRECGYTVLEAVDGQEAMRLADRHAAGIDLLVTDVVMPDMSGAELARKMVEKMPDLRVLYVSGYMGSTLAQHGIAQEQANLLKEAQGQWGRGMEGWRDGGRGNFRPHGMMPGRGNRMMPGYQAPTPTPEANS